MIMFVEKQNITKCSVHFITISSFEETYEYLQMTIKNLARKSEACDTIWLSYDAHWCITAQ